MDIKKALIKFRNIEKELTDYIMKMLWIFVFVGFFSVIFIQERSYIMMVGMSFPIIIIFMYIQNYTPKLYATLSGVFSLIGYIVSVISIFILLEVTAFLGYDADVRDNIIDISVGSMLYPYFESVIIASTFLFVVLSFIRGIDEKINWGE